MAITSLLINDCCGLGNYTNEVYVSVDFLDDGRRRNVIFIYKVKYQVVTDFYVYFDLSY